MISQSMIDEALKRLIKVYQPLQIYLYGDYAWGVPNEESTYDMLIVVESAEKNAMKRGYAGSEALMGMGIPKTITVFTKTEFDVYVQNPKSSTYEIKNKGKIVYARA